MLAVPNAQGGELFGVFGASHARVRSGVGKVGKLPEEAIPMPRPCSICQSRDRQAID